MPTLEIRRVTKRQDLERFIALPYTTYRRNPSWTPPLRRDVREMLDPDRNPFFEHASLACFLALRDGKVVGRVAAIDNGRHEELHRDQVGFFGFFECVDDAEAARSLVEAAADWARARGKRTLRGPVSPSMNDEAGLLVEGFETPAVIMMPHNPPFYARLLEGCELNKAMDLIAYQSTSPVLPERLARGVARMTGHLGITLRTLDVRRFDAELAVVQRLYNAAWEDNWGFVPMTDREMTYLAKQLRPILVPELAVFAEHQGETVGFGLAIPDMAVALRANPSGRFFPGILRVLLSARRLTRLRILALGTLPNWRLKGVDAILYHHIWREGRERGFDWGEASWILETNALMRNALERMGFSPYKTYRLYEKAL